MKILKYLKSILIDVMKTLIQLIVAISAILMFCLLAIGILYIIAFTSGFICKIFGGNIYILYGCLCLWVIGIFSVFEEINPIKGFINMIVDIKKYFIRKWNEIQ